MIGTDSTQWRINASLDYAIHNILMNPAYIREIGYFWWKIISVIFITFFWILDDTSRIGIIWFELWRWKPCPFDKEIDVGTTNRFRNEDLHITRAIWNICYIICCIFIVSGWRQVTSFTPRAKKTWNCIFFSAISGIIDDIQKHFDIGPSQTSLLRTRIVEFRLV